MNGSEAKSALRTIESIYGFPVREPDKRVNEVDRTPRLDIKRLWSRHKEIINLDSLGYKGSEIAKMLGITQGTVSNVLNSTLGKELQELIRRQRDEKYEDLRDEVLELTEKSLKVYHEILNEPDESGRVSLMQKKATADTVMLELSGMRAAQKVDNRHLSVTLTGDEIESFKKRGLEAARASGKLVVIEGEDVT